MHKNKITRSIFFLTVASLIASCNPQPSTTDTTPASTPDSTITGSTETTGGHSDSTPNSSTASSPADSSTTSSPADSSSSSTASLRLKMYGDLQLGSIRSIYALLPAGESTDVVWNTSDASIVSVTPVPGNLPEASLTAKKVGSVTISCHLASDPSVSAEQKITIKDGTVIPADIYSTIAGGLTLSTVQQHINYDTSYTPTVESTYRITTSFEENRDYKNPNLNDANLTDGYYFQMQKDGEEKKVEKTFIRSNGNQVAKEKIDLNNQVGYSLVKNDDGDTISWDNYAYVNRFNNPNYMDASMFKTFDEGKTYHYTGSSFNLSYLISSLYLDNFTPDDVYLTVEDKQVKSITMIVDPYNADMTATNPVETKGGQQIVSTVTARGSEATVPHIKPYEKQPFTDDIQTALTKMAQLKNYTNKMTIEDTATAGKSTITTTFLEDTIDLVTVAENGDTTHTGIHRTENGYYEYKVEAGSKTPLKVADHPNAIWEGEKDGETITRYPTFQFSPNIFDKQEDGSYISKGENADLIRYTAYLPKMFSTATAKGEGELRIDSNSYVTSISATLNVFGADYKVTIENSLFATSKVDLDFSATTVPDAPTTWDDDDKKMGAELDNFTIDGVSVKTMLPYIHPAVGWYGSVYQLKSKNNQCYLETEKFTKTDSSETDEAAMESFIAAYIKVLESHGFTKSSDQDEDLNTSIYKDANGFGVSVVKETNSWNDMINGKVRVTCYAPAGKTIDKAQED